MDFIKTSSLRALIERLYRESAPTAQSGWPRNYCFALGQSHIRPSEVSAKVETDRPITQHDPGNIVLHAATRTTMPREPGNKASRPRNPFRVPRPMHPSEPGKNVPRPAEKPSAKSSSADQRPTVNPSGPDRSDSATTRLSGRSSRTTVPTPRSTRSPF
ncbi:unnamed protein product [Microthlaspi erraticum]|uniref:Uncharacterized protein n=1 Tax=Microthlaspi erraticum TaxID=1685480 RepID=A0A6D2JXS5_9BRAS|nr:unnamed protein product [Microthlaspi erraticum]